MEYFNLHLLSTYLKKWSYMDNRMTFNYSFCCEAGYQRSFVEMRLSSPPNMVNEFLNHVFHKIKETIAEYLTAQGREQEATSNGSNIILVNESEVKRKLGVYIAKILKEFNTNKRMRGKSRIITTRSLDFYYNDFEFEPLSDDIKFYVFLNRGINKMSGDLHSVAVEDLKNALNLKPDDSLANKNMARCLIKLGKYKEAIPCLEKWAQAENTDVALHNLAGVYIRLEEFEKASEIYKQIEEQYPDSLYALFGKAQIAYKTGKGYRQILNKIHKKDPEWLREKLSMEWDFSLPGYSIGDEGMWNAATAARYLGFDRPFDLTRKAFNGEIPSYFDAEKGTIRFVKSELDAWVELNNRYHLTPENYETHPDRLTQEELKMGARKRGRSRKKANNPGVNGSEMNALEERVA